MSDRAYLISRLQTYKEIVENEIKDPVATQLLAETIQELSFEPIDDNLVVHLLKSKIKELETKLKAEGDYWCNGLSRLYVYDKQSKCIHRIGDDRHDALDVRNGELRYHNLQNGDGGGTEDVEGYGYVILNSDNGSLLDEVASYYTGEEAICDLRFEEQIKEYLHGHSESNTED